MKHKNFQSKVADLNEKGIVTIAISRFNVVDAVGDIVRKGAFRKTFTEGGSRIKHVIDHQLKQLAVVGLPLKMYETETHAIVESALNLKKQIARDLFADYKFFRDHGKTLEHSFAYQTMKKNDNSTIQGEEIIELKMFEYSTVALGCNQFTPLMDLKSYPVSALEEYLKKYDISDQKGKLIENTIIQLKSKPIDLNKVLSAYKL
jgi:HK97 family phage prohead protease